jgi:O-antigen/teichoic acid export membrane protein
VKIALSQWLKANRDILDNAGSLVSATAVTSVLGFVYWWAAATLFPPAAVGLASACISTMILLGTVCTLGLGTLLIGELPRQPGKEISLISAALLLVCGVAGSAGLVFVLISPLFSPAFRALQANIATAALFALGVSLTSIMLVLDQALIGLLRGRLQLGRNTLFAIVKLAVLFVPALWLFYRTGLAIYAAWVIGNICSLLAMAGFALLKGPKLSREHFPCWGLLRRLGSAALQHYSLNMILQAPGQALPLLVTIMLSVTMNAWFYISSMLANFVFVVPTALTTVLYAASSARPAALAHKMRLTLGIALATCILANAVLLIGAKEVLTIFGHSYAQQSAWCLRILALGAFPLIIKNHYVALCRIRNRIAPALLPLVGCSLLELGSAALGARLGSLTGLSLGWFMAMCIESMWMAPAIYRAAWPAALSGNEERSICTKQAQPEKSVPFQRCSYPAAVLSRNVRVSALTRAARGMKDEKLAALSRNEIGRRARYYTQRIASLVGCVPTELWDVPTQKLRAVRPPGIMKIVKPAQALSVLFPVCAFALWLFSLNDVHVRLMNDLGLVSVLPASTIIAVAILIVSFCLAVQQRQIRIPVLLLHLVLLIVMLYGTTTLVEDAPRFGTVYRHAGYTEYIMRTGSVNPDLDTYFSWPGFFILSAFVTRAAGYHDVLSYAAWAPVFFNLICLGPLYLIFASATTNKRLIWLALCFFYLTNWIGQDYFSPQGLNFFFYLVILAILLKWFKTSPQAYRGKRGKQAVGRLRRSLQAFYAWVRAPDLLRTPSQPRERVALLAILLAVFLFDVASHPLTPFFIIASVGALVILGRCRPFWLPIVMALMTAFWIIVMARSFLVGHSSMVIGSFGLLGNSITMNVTQRVVGSPGHTFIAKMRLIMTAFLWGLAALGGLRRLLAGYRDATPVVLALAPFPLLVTQDYGGEMLLRIYLFTLPFMAFFAAALFYGKYGRWQRARRARITLAMIALALVLFGGFLFTRYGNERNDYISKAEVDGVRYLYRVAPPGSVLISSWESGPWRFQDYEKYDYNSMIDNPLYNDIADRDIGSIVQFIQNEKRPDAYMVFTRSEEATFDSSSGFAPGALNQLEDALLASGEFKMIYREPDIQILQFVGGA